jgi:uncharacterized protein YxeA
MKTKRIIEIVVAVLSVIILGLFYWYYSSRGGIDAPAPFISDKKPEVTVEELSDVLQSSQGGKVATEEELSAVQNLLENTQTNNTTNNDKSPKIQGLDTNSSERADIQKLLEQ